MTDVSKGAADGNRIQPVLTLVPERQEPPVTGEDVLLEVYDLINRRLPGVRADDPFVADLRQTRDLLRPFASRRDQAPRSQASP